MVKALKDGNYEAARSLASTGGAHAGSAGLWWWWWWCVCVCVMMALPCLCAGLQLDPANKMLADFKALLEEKADLGVHVRGAGRLSGGGRSTN